MENLVFGESLKQNDPVYVLREKLSDIRDDSKRKVRKEEIIALSFKAWNAVLDGKSIKHLYYRHGESFPKISF